MSTRIWTSAASLTALAVTTAGCAWTEADGDDADVLRIAHNSNAAVLPAHVAEEEGFFADEDLEVEFTSVENISTLPQALEQSFDIVQSAPTNVISASAQGISIVQVAGATVDTPENPTAAVIASEESGITEIEELEGRTLGVMNETGTLHIATKYWMHQAGVDSAQVETVQIDGPAQADQIESGRVDAIETIAPFREVVLEGETVDLGDPYLQMAPELCAIVWGADRDWAEENTEELNAFLSALERGREFVEDEANDQRSREILQGYTGLDDEIIDDTAFPTYTSEVRTQDLEVWLEAMQTVDDFGAEVDLEDLILRAE